MRAAAAVAAAPPGPTVLRSCLKARRLGFGARIPGVGCPASHSVINPGLGRGAHRLDMVGKPGRRGGCRCRAWSCP